MDALPDVDALLVVKIGSLVEPEASSGQYKTSSWGLSSHRRKRFQDKELYLFGFLFFSKETTMLRVLAEVKWPNTVVSSCWAFCLFFPPQKAKNLLSCQIKKTKRVEPVSEIYFLNCHHQLLPASTASWYFLLLFPPTSCCFLLFIWPAAPNYTPLR